MDTLQAHDNHDMPEHPSKVEGLKFQLDGLRLVQVGPHYKVWHYLEPSVSVISSLLDLLEAIMNLRDKLTADHPTLATEIEGTLEQSPVYLRKKVRSLEEKIANLEALPTEE
jgi:hypothetical protein